MWSHYFNDFVAVNANKVIESLYDIKEEKENVNMNVIDR
jgi:hypothetical protein